MLERGREKLEALSSRVPTSCVSPISTRPIEIQGASVALLVLTLQFVRPLYRDALLRASTAA